MASSNTAENREGSEKPDIQSIMDEIRDRAKEDIEGNRVRDNAYRPTPSDPNSNASRKAGELVASENLRYLNLHWNFLDRLDPASIQSHRRGIVGKLIVTVKRKVLSLLKSLLKEQFEADRDYRQNLVQYLNDISRYVDARDASNFWELIRKIDVDTAKAMERVDRVYDEHSASLHSTERRIHDSFSATLQELNQRITEIRTLADEHEGKVQTLDSVVRGFESILSARRNAGVLQRAEEGNNKEEADYSYLLLENRFRGSEDCIADRLSMYPPYFQNAKGQVLDIGGGRGELLELFKSNKISAYGVDIDRSMVEQAAARGLDAREGNGIAHLRSIEDQSLGGVIAIQVVEHLQRKDLEEFCALCAKKVEKGGRVIFETINPKSLTALSSNYYRDPTHVWPLHPDTLEYTMNLAGLKTVEVKMLSPIPKEAQLKSIAIESYMTPHQEHTVEVLNDNISRLNNLLYGYQDYCVVAEA